jgi:hypothetical protein
MLGQSISEEETLSILRKKLLEKPTPNEEITDPINI